jgi:glycerophosphoryl diester phosphodiesterase
MAIRYNACRCAVKASVGNARGVAVLAAWLAGAACSGAGDGGGGPGATPTPGGSPGPSATARPTGRPDFSGACPDLPRAGDPGHVPPRTAGASLATCATKPECREILVIAHRGAHLENPENSLAAIEDTVRIGADGVEVDVRTTADGALVLMHDAEVDRTTNGAGNVREMTLEQVGALRLTMNVDLLTGERRVTGEHVPTFAEALRAARGRLLVDVDWKAATPEALARVLTEEDALGFVVVHKGDDDLTALRALVPDVAILPNVAGAADPPRLTGHFGRVEMMELQVAPDAAVVAAVRAAGARVWADALGPADLAASVTCNTSAWRDLITAGVDILQTDEPSLLLPVAKAR